MNRLFRCLFILFVLPLSFASNAKVNYHYYYDSTTQWRTLSSGWSGFYSYANYYTTYFDGDTTIGKNQYYMRKELELDSIFYAPGLAYVDTILKPWTVYFREDSTHKVWYFDPSTGQDVLEFDYGIPVKIGDTFQIYTCPVERIDSVYLGSLRLKRVQPAYLNARDSLQWTRGWVEGVGWTGPVCGTGIESNSLTVCSMRQGYTLNLSKMVSCGGFLEPIYTKPDRSDKSHRFDEIEYHNGPSTVTLSAEEKFQNRLRVYPNPAKDLLYVKGLLRGTCTVTITDVTGRQLTELHSEGGDLSIPVSDLPSGCYQIRIEQGKMISNVRFVKM